MSLFLIVVIGVLLISVLVRRIVTVVHSRWELRQYRPQVTQVVDVETDMLVLDEHGNKIEELDTIETVFVEHDDDFDLPDQVTTIVSATMMSDPDEATREQAYRERFRSDANYAKKKGRREEYEKKLIEGMAFDPHNDEVLRALAEYYFTYNQSKKALPLLKKIVDHHPDDHKALWQIAEIYLEGGDLETSELLTSKALSISPQNPKYAITLTEIYYNTWRLDDAIRSMEDVVKWRPSHVWYREALAKLYEEANEIELAQECYQSLIEIDPNNVRAKKKVLELRNKL